MAPEVSRSAGSGERVERARRLRRQLSQIVAGAAGLVLGVLVALRTQGDDVTFSPAIAIALAATYVALLLGTTILHSRLTDEFEIRETHRAAMGGGWVYMIGYPVWWFLWLGGLAPEPDHEMLFLAFCGGVTLSFIYYRFR